MRINSNISRVIGQIDRVQRAVPKAIAIALAPGAWIEQARATARAVITPLATPEQEPFIAEFIRAIEIDLIGSGHTQWTLDPSKTRLDIRQTVVASAVAGDLPLLQAGIALEYDEVRDLIRDWVVEEKILTEMDVGKTPDDITNGLMRVLFHANRTEMRVEGTAHLLPHLQSFYERKREQAGINSAVLNGWLRNTLAVWRLIIREQALKRVRREIHRIARG